MTKQEPFSNPAFKASAGVTAKGFNLAPQVNTFNSVFDPKPLEKKEEIVIETLLIDNFLPGRIQESQIEVDADQLKRITTEIKAIIKQGAVLVGERVYRAREILKPYRDGAFTQWIEMAFGSRKTAYNMLAYYELYSNISDQATKEKFTKLPQKAAYLLASKNVDISEKMKIIDSYSDSNSEELITLIQDSFPVDQKDGRRKAATKTLLDSLEIGLKKVLKRKELLTDDHFSQIQRLKGLIDLILKPSSQDVG